ncbi:MAG TPA: MarR family transcriptional regulator [Vicinamibacteria bacterium]|nr:MarR family transcriptional regulator [Vicinamibacteria bacterium]
MTDLAPPLRQFVLHWGEMGARWGINRTVAQIHALLYVSEPPLTAEAIAETLSVARSNVSVSLRELQAWGLVRVVHLLGDRRDHFQTTKDVWEMFQIVIEGRKRREVDPIRAVLRELMADPGGDLDEHARARLAEMLAFFELTTAWYEQVRKMPKSTLARFAKMGSRVARLLDSA